MSDTFASFRLPAPLMAGLEAMNFLKPTPIQSKAIPPALTGRDLMGMAQTGTGKTAAFVLPIMVHLMNSPDKIALILAPTRELALQIKEFIKQVGSQGVWLKSALLIGGAPMKKQFFELEAKPRIIVATPGRLADHLRRQPKLLAQAKILVLDEADRMLDMGFYPQIKMIQRFLPPQRQTMMFSATFPANIKRLAQELLRQPVEVSIGNASKPVQKIAQEVVETTVHNKNDILLDQLNARKGSVLIFARTKSRTSRLSRYLMDYGYAVTQIHGDRTLAQRRSAIEGFRSGQYRILVATDIVSRGLDIDDIAHVINYDLPHVPEDYVHRIGRTARNGKAGQSLCLLTPEDRGNWKAITRFISTGH